LIFSILENNDEVHAEIDADGHHLDFSSKQDYFGTHEYQIRAFDKGIDGVVGGDPDLYTDGNTFMVTVWPTNDAPIITAVGDKTITTDQSNLELFGSEGINEDEWFNLTIKCIDVDDDTLGFIVDHSLSLPAVIDIQSDTVNKFQGYLSILATNEHVGILDLNLTVTDNNETGTGPLTDFILLKIEIQNTNDLPKFDQLPDQIGYEDSWLNFTVSADDDDLIHGDSLVYSTNITGEMSGLIKGENYMFNSKTGNISILADNDMVGIYPIEFQVQDLSGIADKMTLNVIINNVNDLPVAVVTSPLHQEVFNTTTQIYFDGANCTDDDLIHGDSLSFLWSSNFNDSLSTEPQFSTILTDTGWHNITLTIKDSQNAEATTTFSIKISKAAGNGDDPGPDDDDPKDDDPNKDPDSDNDDRSWDWMSIMIIAVIIVIIIGAVLFILLRRRKLEHEIEKEFENAQTPPLPAQPAVPLQPMDTPPQQMLVSQPEPQAKPSVPVDKPVTANDKNEPPGPD
jgi:hypothetical protein